ncbi:hypothetical protein C1J03_20485 [Sulfitobacter sp. SK012]|uniref:hypothetical protein n=1 Tax=Sulfitobacter sp. SK012 TaxID=1389005 RepID=UPI000E0A0E63|nr:hypothetical protein [Sulfitobacter sp. SK012]AXI48168.1 hypothetical protein C1J03_20485 [Sulfitobacter sp. SK012]
MPDPILVHQSAVNMTRPITHFQVFGERRSGTTYLRSLMEQNLKAKAVHHYGWKHGFMTVPAVSSEALIICIVRDPLEWILSLHATPFAAEPQLKELSLSKFLRAEWDSIARPAGQGWRNAGYRQNMSLRGEVLQLDRHPIEGRRFHNILEMRTVKLRAHIGMTQRFAHACVVTLDDARDRPEMLVDALESRFGLARSGPFKPIQEYVGNKGNPPSASLDDLSPEDHEFIQKGLDWTLERPFGYDLTTQTAKA